MVEIVIVCGTKPYEFIFADPDTAKRMVRLKRRAVERRNSLNGKSSGFKVPCKFYVEGKCHKGVDCNYSHDCPVPRKKELCKFFLQGFCG